MQPGVTQNTQAMGGAMQARSRSFTRYRRRHGWKGEAKGGSLGGGSLEAHLAAMGLDDVLDDA
jgi:phage gp16-like protein